MRPPRLADGVEWSQVRLANRRLLEGVFSAWGDDWAAEQTEVAWVQRWFALRRATLRDGATPFVVRLDGRLIGEMGIDAVDAVSNSGEVSVWLGRDHGSQTVMYAASLLLARACFTRPRPFDRIFGPLAATNSKGPRAPLAEAGYIIEGTVTRRVGDAGFVEHDVWTIHNTPANRRMIQHKLAAVGSGLS